MNSNSVPQASPSDANLFDALPYAWWWKHANHWGYKPYTNPGAPRMDRGNAVEPALPYLLEFGCGDESIAQAVDLCQEAFLEETAETRAKWQAFRHGEDAWKFEAFLEEVAENALTDEESVEYRDIPLYVQAVANALQSEEWANANLGELIHQQLRVQMDVTTDLATQQWRGFVDFRFGRGCVDLKTTRSANLSGMSADHALQTSFYRQALGGDVDQYCLYVKPVGLTKSGKKSTAQSWKLVKLSEEKFASGRSRIPALSAAMAAIYQMDTRLSKLVCLPRDPSHFRWDEQLRQLAKQEWGIV